VLGTIAAALWWQWRGPSDASAWALLTGHIGVDLWQDLAPRALHSLALVLGSMAVATTSGLALAMIVARCGRVISGAVSVLGQALGAMPVIGIAWSCIVWLVNDQKLPIESLIPYTPPPERDAWELQWGRTLWAWLVPMSTLALALFGPWLSTCVTVLNRLWPLPIEGGLRAKGLSPSSIAWSHWLPLAWAELRGRWLHLSLAGMGYAVWVEDVFGLPGWGAFLARGLKQGDAGDIASALYVGAWLAAALTFAAGLFRSRSHRHVLDATAAVVKAEPRSFAGTMAALAALALTLIGALCLPTTPAVWVTDWLLPWLTGMLPTGWHEPVRTLVPVFLLDAHQAGAIVLRAALIVPIVGTMSALLRQVRALPQLRVLDGIAWQPLLMMAAVGGSPRMMALLLGLAGASRWRDWALALHAADYTRADKVLGRTRLRRWLAHIGPSMLLGLAAWSLRMVGTVLLWIVLIDSLHEGPSLGGRIAAARATVLADFGGVLWPTLFAALGTLLFHTLGRVVEGPHDSSLKFPRPRLR
jgi:ABC-type dipeptide/oligopeptide/nickel transport system permease component